ncbi:M23 family metallopeptidase [Pseudoalteromonas tetraodonis]|uniref:M23 family metallopeptidase n=1 Tax=Pseudoalteromonas tetraodonis TaxID=43659 RepID=UPI00084980B7|nr:M23 family metallopeptidase [Pseudoalteromonas tetraodonis]ODS12894.1 peptidase M23 [Pseudoalteromonas tetraodonis]
MPLFIKSFFNKHFPARQLLIRQNGEVKHVVLTPWLQVSVLAIIFIAIVWMSVSSIRVYMQTHQISHIEQTQLDKQVQWQQKVKQQQQRYALQQEQLAELEQKQALLQGMIESLPASISKDVIKLEGELESSPINENESEFHEPLEEDKTQNKHAQNSLTSFEQRYTLLNQQYDTNFILLAAQINQRHDAILEILQDTGLENALAQHLALSTQTTAQGGPLDILDESKIPSTFLAIADKLLLLNQLESFLTALPNTLPLPAAKYYISSNFGLRKDPMNKRRAFHKGIDLAGWHKTEIFAPADGTVRRAGRNGGYGNFIELAHKNGVVTRFGHLNKINVKKGQLVTKHDVIGLMGSTGRSTSTHLHYEVLIDDKHVNPLKITKALSRVW